MTSSKQVTLYLRREDIDKITAHLKGNGFLFIADEITEKPAPVYVPLIFTAEKWWAHYITFAGVTIDSHTWQEEGKTKYRIMAGDIEAIESRIVGYEESEQLFIFQFYYDPAYFENHSTLEKSPDFEQVVDEFFAWLKQEYAPVPHQPTFYHNPKFPKKNRRKQLNTV